MVINKIHSVRNQKESSSLTNQKKFIRRADITPEIRLELGIQGLSPAYRETIIAELCARYKISHEFIYGLSRILREQGKAMYEPAKSSVVSTMDKVLQSMEFYLTAKMKVQGGLHGLSSLGKSLELAYDSTNFVSQTLETAGNLLSSTLHSDIEVTYVYLCDEVYTGGQAILVTLEAHSMAVLNIKLLEETLTQQDWEESWKGLSVNNINPSEVVKDQGVAMQAATGVLPSQTTILPDSFHAVSHRLGIFISRLTRQVDTAIENEWKRKTFLEKAKSEKSKAKQEQKYEVAQQQTLQAINNLEWFAQCYFIIVQQFRPFTSQGVPRSKADAELAVKEAIEAMKLLKNSQLIKPLDHIEKLLSKGTLFKFLEKVPSLHQQLEQITTPETQWLWALNWQWEKKSRQTHTPKVQKNAKAQAQAARELLTEHYANREQQSYQTIYPKVRRILDQIVQSSALVETFNSILKPFINSARGQISQSLLNLVKFYHNHRQFERGLRKGKAPIEMLRGIKLEKSWIEILMDKIKASFEHWGTTSLKELHQLSKQKSIDLLTPQATICQLNHEQNNRTVALVA